MSPTRTPGGSTAPPGPGGEGAATPKAIWRGALGAMTAERRPPEFNPATAAYLAIAVGIAFRVGAYVAGRQLWQDEMSLLANVSGRPLFEFGVPLVHEQMAPPGYLLLVRAWVRVLGDSASAIRFPSLACGVASLFALWGVARRYVSEAAVPIALALFAVSDVLIYYATEFKQYSTDLLVMLGCLWLGADLLSREWTGRRTAVVGALGVSATWLSHSAVFGLAAVAAVAALDAVARRDWRRLGTALGLGAAWAIGFAGCFAVSDAMMTPATREFLWKWWWFAFMPLPPRSTAEVDKAFWLFANAFSHPVGVATPLGPLGSALLALALFLAGAGVLASRGWRRALLVLLPIALTMGASALERYPFHGRVILFLAPCFVLPVAEGAALVGRRCGRAALAALLALLLVAPVHHALIHSPTRVFDAHGDFRKDLLDYMERQ